MDCPDIDMELLRRIGLAREAVDAVEQGTAGPDELREILASVRSQLSEDFTFLRQLFRSLEEESAEEGSPVLGQATLDALEATESFLFSSAEDDAEDRLRSVAEPLLEKLAGTWPGSVEADSPDDPVPAGAVETPQAAGSAPDIDDVARLLARIPDEPEALDELRAGLASLAPRHEALERPAALLEEADDDPEAVAEALMAVSVAVEAVVLETPEVLDHGVPDPEVEEEAEEVEAPVEGVPDAEAEAARDAGPSDEAPSAEPTPSPAPSDIPPPDPELLKDFLDEGGEHLESAEAALLALEVDPDDEESVNVVFRAFHTIKGVAGFMNLLDVAEAAHCAESLLSRVRDGEIPFTPGIADLTLRSADLLRALLDGVRPLLDGDEAVVPAEMEAIVASLQDEELIQRLVRDEDARPSAPRPARPGVAGGPSAGEADEAAALNPAAVLKGGGADETVRVQTDRLDRLVDLVGELVVAHTMVSQDPNLRGVEGDLARKVDHSTKILRELQDLSTTLRMVPLKGSFSRLARVVRDLSRKSGKPVKLTTSGETTEMDRGMVNVITDPLVHMVRNAVDHAVEPPEEREAAGKPREATIHLAAYQANGGVVIELRDDGRGLDRDRIFDRAVSRGIVDADASLSDKEVWDLIFAPGFSTAEKVTEVSGRGVGMDVVRRGVESLRGVVDVESTPGEGTTFYLRLPLTLAITEGMLLSVGGERYIVPMTKIRESFRPRPADLSTVAGKGECVAHHGDLLPLHRLGRLYGIQGAVDSPTEGLVVVVGDGRRRSALLVDEILDQQSFVVKPLTGLPTKVPGIAGGAVLGDGSVGLIVDPDEIVESVRSRGRAVA